MHASISARHEEGTPNSWKVLRRDLVALLVSGMFVSGVGFTLMDPCPQHWSELPMLICACAIAAFTFLPNLMDVLRADKPWTSFLEMSGFAGSGAVRKQPSWVEFKEFNDSGLPSNTSETGPTRDTVLQPNTDFTADKAK